MNHAFQASLGIQLRLQNLAVVRQYQQQKNTIFLPFHSNMNESPFVQII